MTAPELLCQAFGFAPRADPPDVIPGGATCAVTGVPITEGYPLDAITTDTMADFLDVFRESQWIGEPAARLFAASNPRGDNRSSRAMVAFPDAGYLPLIAREPAKAQGRPCWSDLVREVWPARQGQPCVWILSTSTKRRVWPMARVGALGSTTPVLVYDADPIIATVLTIDWTRLIECLDVVEAIYTAGAPKDAIRTSVLGLSKIPLPTRLAWERTLQPWRLTPECVVATLIAQKREEVSVGADHRDPADAEPRPAPDRDERDLASRRGGAGRQQCLALQPVEAPASAPDGGADADAGRRRRGRRRASRPA